MKTFYTTLLVIATTFAMNGATLVVDNSAGSGAPYTNLSTAINAANQGDTLLVSASRYSYGNINIDKKLIIIGPGHNPLYSSEDVTVGSVSFKNGADSTVLEGLRITSSISSDLYAAVHHIVIRNCLFESSGRIRGAADGCCGSTGNTDHWVIEGNVFNKSANQQFIDLNKSNSDNWIIINNLFIQMNNGGDVGALIFLVNSSTLIDHNVFISRAGFDNHNFIEGSGADVRNNIFITNNSAKNNVDDACSGCQYTYNLTYNTAATFNNLPGSGNLDNTDPLLVNAPISSFSYGYDYHVDSGSLAENAGSDGTDMGLYGGGGYFDQRGLSEYFPKITEFFIKNRVVPQGQPLEVDFKAKRGGLD